MNEYVKLKNRHQKEVDELPIKFAFGMNNESKMMKEFGLDIGDTDKILRISGGSYCLKKDSKLIQKTFKRHQREFNEFIRNDIKGDGFVKDMFLYELRNHEYGYTGEISETLIYLGFDYDEIASNKKMMNGLTLAREIIDNEESIW